MWQLKGGHVHFIRDFFLSPGYGATATRQLLSVCCGLGEEKSTRLSEGRLRPNQMLSRIEIPRHLHAQGKTKVPVSGSPTLQGSR